MINPVHVSIATSILDIEMERISRYWIHFLNKMKENKIESREFGITQGVIYGHKMTIFWNDLQNSLRNIGKRRWWFLGIQCFFI